MKDLRKFKEKLNNGEAVYGIFSKTSDPMFIEIMGIAGFDYVILDVEHGPTDMEHQQNNIRACEVRGIVPIMRIPRVDESTIGTAFDIGVKGIQVPNVKNATEARKVVEYSRFHPYGSRGVCRFVRAADYSAMDRNAYFEESKELIVILQLEGVEAIKNLDEILAVEGYDIIFVGPYDLSQSMGIPGQIYDERVIDAMAKIIKKAREKNVLVGTFADDFDSVKRWKDVGVQYISYSTDGGIFYDALVNVRKNLEK